MRPGPRAIWEGWNWCHASGPPGDLGRLDIVQSVPTPGEVVRVRGRLWTVLHVTRHDDCAAFDLAPVLEAAPRDGGSRRPDAAGVTLLAPFDRPVRMARPRAPLVVSRRRWMRACRAALCQSGDRTTLQAAARADLALLPHQFEPALEMIAHGAPRILIADAVGLGKTIQAAIVLAELTRRHELERALILTPPGLRGQWAGELRQRFGLEAIIADADWLRAMRAEWPPQLNPWSVPGVLIASIDFVKRPDVRRSLDDLQWDLVVVDEAHAASGDSDRRDAADRCACRARRVLLLTATPHAGDEAAFDALTRIGALDADEPIVLFRRSRADAGLPSRRRVHLLRVRSTAAEAAVHRALKDYVRAVWARAGGPDAARARLAMIVLVKRSLSGMAPLLRSLEARHDGLGDAPAPIERQLGLPWGDDEDEEDEIPAGVIGAPGLGDLACERAWLARLIVLTRQAVPGDSKCRALRRLLRRIREPVIVFTEYRDTLAALSSSSGPARGAAVLHGGLDRRAREEVIDRFTRGTAPLLVATDAAGAGLNLQARCRIVVNLELPWNPMRLEQRIGRVDRIGQTATVHAINLLARGTAESAVLARLARRLARADAAVGSVEQVLGWTDEAVATRWIGPPETSADGEATRDPRACPSPERPALRPGIRRPDRRREAASLSAELEQHRALWTAGHGRAPSTRESPPTPDPPMAVVVSAVAGRRLPGPLGRGGVLALVRSGDRLLPLFVEQPVPRLRRRVDVRAATDAFLRAHARQVLEEADTAAAAYRPAVREGTAGSHDALAERAERLAELAPTSSRLHQPGLFDRRGERRSDPYAPSPGEAVSSPRDAGEHASAGSAIALLLLVAGGGRNP